MTHSTLDVLENLLTLEVYSERLVHVALTHRDFLSHEQFQTFTVTVDEESLISG